MIYLIGSLRNPHIPGIGNALRDEGYDVFDDWYAAGDKADDAWQFYEQKKGLTYREALTRRAARHTFEFDLKHLTQASVVVLVTPAGRSGYLELGWALGRDKKGYVLLDQTQERWDLMLCLATGVYDTLDQLLQVLQENEWRGYVTNSNRLDNTSD